MVDLSIIIPASNEAALIGDCLDSVLASDWDRMGIVQVIVVANGCKDDTVGQARLKNDGFAARGWRLDVIDRPEGGKPDALNAGDTAAKGSTRVYLDADVTLSPDILQALAAVLDSAQPAYASGRIRITGKGMIARAYANVWAKVPFMADSVPGCGLFAVNASGRARWNSFPPIISDDTFVRLHFTPQERHSVAPTYDWPVAEGFGNLVRVRRRQDAGVDEIARLYSDLPQNDDARPFPVARKLHIALRHPFGFAVYSTVAIVSRLTRQSATGWSRSR